MVNLKDKLKYYHPVDQPETGNDTELAPHRRVPEHWQALAAGSGGQILRESSGYYYYCQRLYDLGSDPQFDELKEKGGILENLERLAPELSGQSVEIQNVLFFDLETSGLSGGTGTMAFLIGAAHVRMDQIVVHQWVMPDFSDEHLILDHFNKLLENFDYISTFNGKSFDAPLLKSRYILNQLIPEMEDKIHIDLLHISRRLWKKRLQSCRLQNLEKEILGEERVEDIPGALIPSIYFSFLYGNGLEEFKKVLEHNYLDLVNLIRIGLLLEYQLAAPVHRIPETTDFLELIRFLKKQKQSDLIFELLEGRMETDQGHLLVFEMALALKKRKEFRSAAVLLQKLVETSLHPPEVVEEYVKILEHQLKDYATALQLLERKLKAMEIFEQLHGQKNPAAGKLSSRYRRIKLKLDKNST